MLVDLLQLRGRCNAGAVGLKGEVAVGVGVAAVGQQWWG